MEFGSDRSRCVRQFDEAQQSDAALRTQFFESGPRGYHCVSKKSHGQYHGRAATIVFLDKLTRRASLEKEINKSRQRGVPLSAWICIYVKMYHMNSGGYHMDFSMTKHNTGERVITLLLERQELPKSMTLMLDRLACWRRMFSGLRSQWMTSTCSKKNKKQIGTRFNSCRSSDVYFFQRAQI